MRRLTQIVGLAVLVAMASGCVNLQTHTNVDTKPEWASTLNAPEDDAKYAYFVERSGLQPTEDAAVMMATEKARAEAAASLSTTVERLYRYAKDYVNREDAKVLKDPYTGQPFTLPDLNDERLRTEVDKATRMAKRASIYIQRHVKETQFLWIKRQQWSFDAVALVRVPLSQIAYVQEVQELKDKIDTVMADSLGQAEVLWRNGDKTAAIEKLKAEYVHMPKNIAVLEKLAIYEQEAGDLDAAVMHSTAIVNHDLASSAAKSRAEGRLKALIPAQKKEVIDKIVVQ